MRVIKTRIYCRLEHTDGPFLISNRLRRYILAVLWAFGTRKDGPEGAVSLSWRFAWASISKLEHKFIATTMLRLFHHPFVTWKVMHLHCKCGRSGLSASLSLVVHRWSHLVVGLHEHQCRNWSTIVLLRPCWDSSTTPLLLEKRWIYIVSAAEVAGVRHYLWLSTCGLTWSHLIPTPSRTNPHSYP